MALKPENQRPSTSAAVLRTPAGDGRRPSISVVIPVYNSAAILPELLVQLANALPTFAGEYEVILVNDGSRDDSWRLARDAAVTRPWLRVINLMRNFGQHNALLCGIRSARYALVVTIDDDLQHPPLEIPKLLGKLAEGYDVVYGTPAHEKHGLWRTFASQLTKLALQNAMGIETASRVSALRAFRTEVRNAFENYDSSFVSIDVLLTWGTNRFAAVPVRHDPRLTGASNYSMAKLTAHAVNMITGFTVAPLQLASLIGFVFTVFGLGVLAYVLGRYIILGGSLPGFPFLASTIAIFSGAQLFALGIMGEYLARIHYRTMDKPAYVVRMHNGADDQASH